MKYALIIIAITVSLVSCGGEKRVHQHQHQHQEYRYHTIQSGDTYSSLARIYFGDISYNDAIARANPQMQARTLQIGQRIRIPSSPDHGISMVKYPTAEQTRRVASAGTYDAKGGASYYANKFHGRKTASGEKYHKNKYTAAHKKLAFGTKLLVRNVKNGKTVEVVVNDRGPFVRGRIIDLSYVAAKRIDLLAIRNLFPGFGGSPRSWWISQLTKKLVDFSAYQKVWPGQ
ncbi:MAG: septal ring lytic transglycosylase RlpA family protein, partial [Planctomycetes bacterium]|nr:septal ring lytic transglycosylase RlpA family protein [Planctomycetota bacterium]